MKKLLFFSGAGLSADSGLSTFRDAGGLWDKYDPSIVCNYDNWLQNYDLVHEFYSKRRIEYATAKPNNMHNFIAATQAKYGIENVIIITQNIDVLLETAGAANVLHLHGNINYIHCVKCEKEFTITGEFERKVCDKCGHDRFKPSIVFFGEQAPKYSEMYNIFASLDEDDLVTVIGTSGSVIPITSILNHVPARKILCNLEPSNYINEKQYEYVFYKHADDAVNDILPIINRMLK